MLQRFVHARLTRSCNLCPYVPSVFAVVVLLSSGVALAQPAPIPARVQAVAVESGERANVTDRARAVFSQVLDLGPEAPWVQVLFEADGTVLPAGSVIRVTSLLDGETHVLDADELIKWNYATTFLNGSRIEVELIAGRNTIGNAVRIREVLAGERHAPVQAAAIGDDDDDEIGGTILSVCGNTDDRTVTDHAAVGRLLRSGVTRNGRCTGGDNDGQDCMAESDCPEGTCTPYVGVCSGGTFSGLLCRHNPDCSGGVCIQPGQCFSGGNIGEACSTRRNCPGVGAECDANGTCIGGSRNGEPCDCPSSGCLGGNLFFSGCTAFIESSNPGTDKIHLTAGHCFGTWGQGQFTGTRVLQFNVPASESDCTIGHPPVNRQFPVRAETVISVDGGYGNDWAVFKTYPNNEGLTTYEKQGAAFTLRTNLPEEGEIIRVTGYGTDGNESLSGGGNDACTCDPGDGVGRRNQVLQTNSGPLRSGGPEAYRVNHRADTCGGNSGGPIIFPEDSLLVMGIHTNAGCDSLLGLPTGENSGTAVARPELQDAINSLRLQTPGCCWWCNEGQLVCNGDVQQGDCVDDAGEPANFVFAHACGDAVCGSCEIAEAPPFAWARSAGGTGDDVGHGIAVDEFGNTYVTGEFQSSATFAPTINGEPMTLISQGNRDVFVAKYDPAGIVVWARSASAIDRIKAYGIAVDGFGNNYVAGCFQGTATFEDFTLTSGGGVDVFIVKYDPAGNVQWVRSAFTNINPLITFIVPPEIRIAVDGSGSSYVTGYFEGSATFGSFMLTSEDSLDVFVAKYDHAGNVNWATSARGTTGSLSVGYGIAVNQSGVSYVTGWLNVTATFGPFTLTSTGEAVFLAKYDPAGQVLWARSASGGRGSGIAVDGAGNTYVTGPFWGTATFGPFTLTSAGGSDVFLSKYDRAGNVLWAKSGGGSGGDVGMGIAVDGSGNSYVTGIFSRPATFGSFNLTGGRVFVAKYDPAGNVLWAKSAGGSGGEAAMGIAVDDSGDSYVTGRFSGTAMFGDSELTSAGGTDVFVAKLGDAPPPGRMMVTPADGLASSGYQFGPFAPEQRTYRLHNDGTTAIEWTAGVGGAYFALSETGGTLGPGQQRLVTVSVDQGAAGGLPSPHVEEDVLTFTNVTNGRGNTTRALRLEVLPTQPEDDERTEGLLVTIDHLWQWDEAGGRFAHPGELGQKGVIIDPTKPTYLLTHGWDGTLDGVGHGTPCREPSYAMSSIACAVREVDPEVNILAWDWMELANPNGKCDFPDELVDGASEAALEAFVSFLTGGLKGAILSAMKSGTKLTARIAYDAYRAGDVRVEEEGNKLGRALADVIENEGAIGSELHLIGKSHGGGVLARAATIMAREGVAPDSLTTLDTPKIGCVGGYCLFRGRGCIAERCLINTQRYINPGSVRAGGRTAVLYYPKKRSGGFGQPVSGMDERLTNLELNPDLTPSFSLADPWNPQWIDHLWIAGLDEGVCRSDDGWYPQGVRSSEVRFDGGLPVGSILSVFDYPSGCFAEQGMFEFASMACEAVAAAGEPTIDQGSIFSLIAYEPFVTAASWSGNLVQLIVDPFDPDNRVILMEEQGDASFFKDIEWPEDALEMTFEYMFGGPRERENLTVYVGDEIAYYDNAEISLSTEGLTRTGPIAVDHVAGTTAQLNFVFRTDEPKGGELGGELLIDNIRVFAIRPGDVDLEGDRDLFDVGVFQNCYGRGVEEGDELPPECWTFDMDGDGAIDVLDWVGDADEDVTGFVDLLDGPWFPPIP